MRLLLAFVALLHLCPANSQPVSIIGVPLISSYRVYLATSTATALSGFIYDGLSTTKFTFETCLTRSYAFCTDSTAFVEFFAASNFPKIASLLSKIIYFFIFLCSHRFVLILARVGFLCSGRRSNNSVVTSVAAISPSETMIQYDPDMSALVYVAFDRKTIRRMAPDGSDRQIIYNTAQTILGTIAFDSPSGTYFYITKSVRGQSRN